MSSGVDALGIPDQYQLDRMVGADRTACVRCGAPQPRAQASAPPLNATRYLCTSRCQPIGRREAALLESACAPGQDPGTTCGLEAKPPRLSLPDPLPPAAAEIINTVAGRLPLSGERPTHPKALVSPSLIPKRPSCPSARGHVVWHCHCAECASHSTLRSLAEPAGWVGFGQFAMCMVRGDFAGFVGLDAVRFSAGQLRLQPRRLTALGECISPVLTQHARHPHRRCQRFA